MDFTVLKLVHLFFYIKDKPDHLISVIKPEPLLRALIYL